MPRMCKDAVIIGFAVAIGVIAPGCSSGWFRKGDDQGNAVESPDVGDVPEERPSADQQPEKKAENLAGQERLANLAAVQDFLDRTARYALREDQDQHPPVPAEPNDDGTRPGIVDDQTSENRETLASKMRAAVAPSSASGEKVVANASVELVDPQPIIPALALPVVKQVSIRSAPVVSDDRDGESPRNTTNAPLSLGARGRAVTLEEIVADLKQRAKNTSDLDAQWRLSLIQLALGRNTEAGNLSANLSPDTRRILTAFVEAGTAARSAARNPFMVGDHALGAVEGLREVLAELADPVISTIALCRQVVTFGVYERMAPEDFIAGRTTQTIVYCEVRNFSSEPTADGRYRTRLASRIELLTASDGKSVWQLDEPKIEDICHQRRTDFFLAQRATLPPTLPAGEYVLKVGVEDKLSGKVGEASVPVSITEPVSLARRP